MSVIAAALTYVGVKLIQKLLQPSMVHGYLPQPINVPRKDTRCTPSSPCFIRTASSRMDRLGLTHTRTCESKYSTCCTTAVQQLFGGFNNENASQPKLSCLKLTRELTALSQSDSGRPPCPVITGEIRTPSKLRQTEYGQRGPEDGIVKSLMIVNPL